MNEHNSYPEIIVKWPLSCSWTILTSVNY